MKPSEIAKIAIAISNTTRKILRETERFMNRSVQLNKVHEVRKLEVVAKNFRL